MAPRVGAAHDAFPDACTTTVDCIGETTTQNVVPEQVVVCKNYPAGVAGPAVTINLDVVSTNNNGSPTSLSYSLQPNSCLRLWYTRGAPDTPDQITVTEAPVPGYIASSQVTTSVGPRATMVVTQGPVTSNTTVTGITGGVGIPGMLVVFTNTPEPPPPPPLVLGKTMGYWGNNNGTAQILAAGGYAVNAVNIGRGGNINTQAKSAKVLPNTKDACGKSATIIFTGQTATTNCSLASGVNVNSLNTHAAQTLALGYNIALGTGYSGQTIGTLGCGAYLTAGLTSASTVNAAFAAAVGLNNGSGAAGSTTQSALGEMNALLGCLNREA